MGFNQKKWWFDDDFIGIINLYWSINAFFWGGPYKQIHVYASDSRK